MVGQREDMGHHGLSRHSESAIDDAIASAALAAERKVCAARVVFFGAILVRFLFVSRLTAGRVLITTIPLGVTILFSLWVLLRVRHPRGERLFLVSVLLDAITAFLALLPNALWPSPQYLGILHIPDTTGVLIAALAAGLRLSFRAAWIGGVANAAGIVGLVLVDKAVSGPRFTVGPGPVSVYVIFVLGAGLLAAALALVTRRLAQRGAAAALRADRAEQGLGSVLAESHDLGSLLTSATISAELVARELESSDRRDLRARSCALLENLLQIRAMAGKVKQRALVDLTTLNERVPVPLTEAIHWVFDQIRARHPGVSLELDAPDETHVVVAGGQPTLNRILLNLLLNSCEADGRPETVDRVQVHVDGTSEQTVRVRIRDNGPGFPSAVLGGASASTKADGTGVGLSVVRGLTEASGGMFRFGNREGGGAEAVLTLQRGVSSN